MGWDRYDTAPAVEAMNDLYRNELRLWLNLFQPSAKLIQRVRAGSKLRRRYDLPHTPLDRLAAWETDDATVRTRLAALLKLRQGLDPFELSRQIDRKLDRLYALAHTSEPQGSAKPSIAAGYILGGATPWPRVTFLNCLTGGPGQLLGVASIG